MSEGPPAGTDPTIISKQWNSYVHVKSCIIRDSQKVETTHILTRLNGQTRYNTVNRLSRGNDEGRAPGATWAGLHPALRGGGQTRKAAACDSTRESVQNRAPRDRAGKQVTGCQEPVTAGAGFLLGRWKHSGVKTVVAAAATRDHTPQKLAVKARFPLEGKKPRACTNKCYMRQTNSLDAGLCQACYSAFQKKNLKKTKHCFNTCRRKGGCLEAPGVLSGALTCAS